MKLLTNRQTDRQADRRQEKHNLLDGGDYDDNDDDDDDDDDDLYTACTQPTGPIWIQHGHLFGPHMGSPSGPRFNLATCSK